jgi:hypothetical protein
VNASTCAAIATFFKRSDAAKWSLGGRTIRPLANMRIDVSDADVSAPTCTVLNALAPDRKFGTPSIAALD